jgi:hypothetical protein
MQFNTAYLRELIRYGITADDVARAGCYSFDLAAWRLRMHIKRDRGDIWTRVANYHSRTPRYSAVYRSDIIRRAVKWADWLEARFTTYKFGAPNGIGKVNPVPTGSVQVWPVSRPASHTMATSYVPSKLIINRQR